MLPVGWAASNKASARENRERPFNPRAAMVRSEPAATDAAGRTNGGFGTTRYRYWVFRLALDLLSSVFQKAGKNLLAQPERSTRPFR